jgi:hypothetical protein
VPARHLTPVLLLAFMAVVTARTVLAASFCMVGQGMPPQCYYDDIAACQQAANSPGNYCEISPDAQVMYFGDARYCTVRSDRVAQCLYVDRNACNAEAARTQAICFDRISIGKDKDTKEKNPDPFRYDNRIQR